ncbi:hypothetical protein JOC34_000855 [Virgibacillus halotolerans]|nr:hypothetical protein [Virgibacillus halotolerans]
MIKQAKEQGISAYEVRQELSNHLGGAKFIYQKDDSGRVANRVLEVSDFEQQAIISMAVAHYKQYYINRGWDNDSEMTEFYDLIVKVDNVLNGITRSDQTEFRKIGGK